MMQKSPSARIGMTLAPDSFYIPLRVTEWCETTGDDALEAAAPLFRILIVSGGNGMLLINGVQHELSRGSAVRRRAPAGCAAEAGFSAAGNLDRLPRLDRRRFRCERLEAPGAAAPLSSQNHPVGVRVGACLARASARQAIAGSTAVHRAARRAVQRIGEPLQRRPDAGAYGCASPCQPGAFFTHAPQAYRTNLQCPSDPASNSQRPTPPLDRCAGFDHAGPGGRLQGQLLFEPQIQTGGRDIPHRLSTEYAKTWVDGDNFGRGGQPVYQALGRKPPAGIAQELMDKQWADLQRADGG